MGVSRTICKQFNQKVLAEKAFERKHKVFTSISTKKYKRDVQKSLVQNVYTKSHLERKKEIYVKKNSVLKRE